MRQLLATWVAHDCDHLTQIARVMAKQYRDSITTYGDDETYRVSVTYGAPFAGGRGHLLLSAEYYNQQGIHSYEGRDWYQAWGSYGAGTQANPFRFAPGMISNNATLDGLISAPGTAINGWRSSVRSARRPRC